MSTYTVSGLVLAIAMVAASPVAAQLRPTLPGDDTPPDELRQTLDQSAIPAGTSNVAPILSEPIDADDDFDDFEDDDDADGDNGADTLSDGNSSFRQLSAADSRDDSPFPTPNSRARRAPQVGLIDETGAVTPLANTPVRPVQGGGAAGDDDPYAPLGIRFGTLTLLPSLTQTVGHTSNADLSADGEESGFSITEARLAIVSDWALHELRADVLGSFQTFFSGDNEDIPVLQGNVQLRLDHQVDFTTTLGATVRASTESAQSDNLTVPPPASVVGRPDVMTYSGFVETQKRIGRVTGLLRGSAARTTFGDADISTGLALDQSDRDNTLFEGSLRLTYEASPAFNPFVEGELGARIYDEAVDRNGIRRDSMIYSLRGGVAFDRNEKLNGEIAVGYSVEDFDDAALEALDGLTVDGTINWSPARLTTISATAQTTFTPSTNAGESGSVTYAAGLAIARDVRPNLTLNAQILASLRESDGAGREDKTLQATAGAEWRLNRGVAITGQVGYETVDSTDPGSTYDAFTARIALRLQR